MRSSFGAGFPLFATAMYKNLGVAWASSTLGFLSIAFIPIPFVLYRVSCSSFSRSLLQVPGIWLTLDYQYGETIRKRSKLARQDF